MLLNVLEARAGATEFVSCTGLLSLFFLDINPFFSVEWQCILYTFILKLLYFHLVSSMGSKLRVCLDVQRRY